MKKIFCMIIVSILSLSIFTACSQVNELPVKTTAPNEPTTVVSDNSEQEDNQEEEENSYYINNPIDVECEEVLGKESKNSKKSEIIQGFALTWKEEAVKNYDMLYEILSDSDKKIIKTAQNDWEEFAKSELQYQYARAKILGLDEETSHNNAVCYYEMYKERAFELRRYYDEITEKYGDKSYFEVEEDEDE